MVCGFCVNYYKLWVFVFCDFYIIGLCDNCWFVWWEWVGVSLWWKEINFEVYCVEINMNMLVIFCVLLNILYIKYYDWK